MTLAGTRLEQPEGMHNKAAITVPVRGVFSERDGGAGSFTGTLSITSFVHEGGRIVVVGTLTGSLVDSRGHPLAGTALAGVRLPLDFAVPGVGELGLSQVELLGQRVHLDKVILGMTGPLPRQRPAPSLDSPGT